MPTILPLPITMFALLASHTISTPRSKLNHTNFDILATDLYAMLSTLCLVVAALEVYFLDFVNCGSYPSRIPNAVSKRNSNDKQNRISISPRKNKLPKIRKRELRGQNVGKTSGGIASCPSYTYKSNTILSKAERRSMISCEDHGIERSKSATETGREMVEVPGLWDVPTGGYQCAVM